MVMATSDISDNRAWLILLWYLTSAILHLSFMHRFHPIQMITISIYLYLARWYSASAENCTHKCNKLRLSVALDGGMVIAVA